MKKQIFSPPSADSAHMKNFQSQIRQLLRKAPDGLTVKDIKLLSGTTDRSKIRYSLEAMPDAYIDRWTKDESTCGRYAAVWCVVIPPENCPPPDKA